MILGAAKAGIKALFFCVGECLWVTVFTLLDYGILGIIFFQKFHALVLVYIPSRWLRVYDFKHGIFVERVDRCEAELVFFSKLICSDFQEGTSASFLRTHLKRIGFLLFRVNSIWLEDIYIFRFLCYRILLLHTQIPQNAHFNWCLAQGILK